MKNRILGSIFMLCMLIALTALFPVAANAAANGTCGDNLTWTLDDNGNFTISGTGAMTNYKFSVMVPWNSYDKEIKTITIEKGVTSIGDFAFFGCSYVETVYWNAKNVSDFTSDYNVFTDIGYYSDGVDIIFGDEVEHIPAYAFSPYSCRRLTPYSYLNISSVTFGKNIKSIGNYAFFHCEETTFSALPYGLESIGRAAFEKCQSMKDIVIPETVTNIGYSAFYQCTGIKEVTIRKNMTLGNSIFSHCTDIESVTIEDGVTSIPSGIFSYCTGIKNVTLPNSVTSIGSHAFYETSLESIIIPEAVTSIGSSAFDGTAITSITIPENVTSIGYSAFDNCTLLEEIYWNAKNVSDLEKDKTLFTEAGTQSDKNLKVVFGDKVEHIPAYAFCKVSKILTIDIPQSVKSIGAGAFYKCMDLTTVNLPKGLTAIEDYTFIYCYALTDLTIPESVTSIGQYAFFSTGVNSNIPKNVASIGQHAFYGANMTSLDIPQTMTTIEDYTFRYCEQLTTVTLPRTITSIGYYAFANCSALTDVYYLGTKSKWDSMTIDDGNSCLINATIHYLDMIAVYYDANGGKDAPEAQNSEKGIDFQITTQIPSYTGYKFLGWATTPDATEVQYTSGDTISALSEDITLYAVWEKAQMYTETEFMDDIFMVSATSIPQGSYIVLACYDENGELVHFAMKEYAYNYDRIIPFYMSAQYDTAKVFVWNSIENMLSITIPETL